MDQKLKDKLIQRKEEGTLRSLSSFSGMIDFQSNDYLGLAKVQVLSDETSFGATGSRLISGTSEIALETEQFIATYFNSPASLFFNSGYDANLGFFGAVPQRGDTVLFDEEIHASVRDGLRLSFAKSYSFKHNDVQDLQRLLQRIQGTCYVAVESLYSMSGDIAPLMGIVALCESYGAYLVVDEAHAAGSLGAKGQGVCIELGIEERVFARLITFGKSFGTHGAAYLCSHDMREYLINYARSFIYSTALPPQVYERITELLRRDDLAKRRVQLQENIRCFRTYIPSEYLMSSADSPIQSLRLDGVEELMRIHRLCLSEGFAVKAVFSPTVQKGKECLRINLRADHSLLEIQNLCELLMKNGPSDAL
jgi:8-amino-7-oxononanoate synthase